MKEYAWIFLLIAMIAGLNAAWVGFWALMGASGSAGAQLSKKVGTDNAQTDEAIKVGKAFTMEMVKKAGIRAAIATVAYIIYLIVQ